MCVFLTIKSLQLCCPSSRSQFTAVLFIKLFCWRRIPWPEFRLKCLFAIEANWKFQLNIEVQADPYLARFPLGSLKKTVFTVLSLPGSLLRAHLCSYQVLTSLLPLCCHTRDFFVISSVANKALQWKGRIKFDVRASWSENKQNRVDVALLWKEKKSK